MTFLGCVFFKSRHLFDDDDDDDAFITVVLSPAVSASHSSVNPGLSCLILLLLCVSLVTCAPSCLCGCGSFSAGFYNLWDAQSAWKLRAEPLKQLTQQWSWQCLILSCHWEPHQAPVALISACWEFLCKCWPVWWLNYRGGRGCFLLSIQFMLGKKLKAEPLLPSVTPLAIPLLYLILCWFWSPKFWVATTAALGLSPHSLVLGGSKLWGVPLLR